MGERLRTFREYLLSAPVLDGVRRRLRTFNSGLLLSLLSSALSRPLVLTSGRIVVIAPHQDDETLGCGGLIALKRQRDAEVSVVFLTDGGAAPLPEDGRLSRDDLPSMRVLEARKAARALGVPERNLHFWGLPDGKLKALSDERRSEIIDRLCALLAERAPTKVLVPHWDDGHGDHEAAFALAVTAIAQLGKKIEVLQYSIWGPWLHPLFRPTGLRELRQAYRLSIAPVQIEKSTAIAAYTSQTATLPVGFLSRFQRPYELFFPVSPEPSRESRLSSALKVLLCVACGEFGLVPEFWLQTGAGCFESHLG